MMIFYYIYVYAVIYIELKPFLQEPTIDPCTTLPITGYVIKTTFNGHTITSRQISAFDQIMTISFDKIFPGNLHSNTEYNFSVTALITELDTTAVVITQDTCNNGKNKNCICCSIAWLQVLYVQWLFSFNF